VAKTSSLETLGTPLPDFTLPDLQGSTWSPGRVAGDAVLVVVFACNHCPYVRHIEQQLGRVAAKAPATVVAICSNDAVTYPEDAPEQLAQQAIRAAWGFPYLVDEDQSVARRFGAVCTPDFFVYGPERRLAYRGAFDGSTPKNGEPVTGALLTEAVDLLNAGQGVPEPHRPSMGCGIKWKP
jgi:peroxiredoxin